MVATAIHSTSIPKAFENDPGLNFNMMLLEGIAEIERLSGTQWSNYNASDPGIVMLENLCYGLLNLGYKSEFTIPDLLTGPDGKTDYSQLFFQPSAVMFTNPVTIDDFRRLLLDKVAGLKNVWIKPAKGLPGRYTVSYEMLESTGEVHNTDQEFVSLLSDLKTLGNAASTVLQLLDGAEEARWQAELGKLKLKAEALKKNNKPKAKARVSKKVKVELQKVQKWQELLPQVTQYKDKEKARQFLKTYQSKVHCLCKGLTHGAIMAGVAIDAYLMRHRNLGELFGRSRLVCQKEISLNELITTLYLDADADPEAVLAQVIYEVNNYFSPFVKRHSYPQLLAEGHATEAILNGPQMAHGYITDAALAKPLGKWNPIDIARVISTVPGVRRVSVKSELKSIELVGYINPSLPLGINLFLGSKQLGALQTNRVVNGYHEWVAENQLPGGLPADELYPEPPQGDFRAVAKYHSIQNLFPSFMGLNNASDLATISSQEGAQIKQLKAFLMLFEQILADHQAQLAGISQLLGFEQPTNEVDTFLTQGLYDTPGVRSILKAFDGFVKQNDATAVNPEINWNDFVNAGNNTYLSHLRQIQATDQEQIERRNQSLSHQLAVVGERFAIDPIIDLNPNYGNYGLARVGAITALLEHFPLISANLGRSYFYFENPVKVLLAGLELKLGLMLNVNGYYQGLLDLIERVLNGEAETGTLEWKNQKLLYHSKVILDLRKPFEGYKVSKSDEYKAAGDKKPHYCYARMLRCLIQQTEGFVFIDEILLGKQYACSEHKAEGRLRTSRKVTLLFPAEICQIWSGSFEEMLHSILSSQGPLSVEYQIKWVDYESMLKLLYLRRLWLTKFMKLQRVAPKKIKDKEILNSLDLCKASVATAVNNKSVAKQIQEIICSALSNPKPECDAGQ